MNENQQQLNDIDQEPGASSWISSGRSLAIVLGFDNIRYGWEITRLPENCFCGVTFGLQHALFSEKKDLLQFDTTKSETLLLPN